jgi:hypothetical protein
MVGAVAHFGVGANSLVDRATVECQLTEQPMHELAQANLRTSSLSHDVAVCTSVDIVFGDAELLANPYGKVEKLSQRSQRHRPVDALTRFDAVAWHVHGKNWSDTV